MASKIHTDDPKHHKFVVVNKVQRKKLRRFGRFLRVKKMHLNRWLYEQLRPKGWWWRGHRHIYTMPPLYGVPHRIVYDDANHLSYRLRIKTSSGWRWVRDRRTGKPKTFHKNYGQY